MDLPGTNIHGIETCKRLAAEAVSLMLAVTSNVESNFKFMTSIIFVMCVPSIHQILNYM